MPSKYIVAVYNKPNCPKCKMTERFLNEFEIPYEVTTLDILSQDEKVKQESSETIQRIKEQFGVHELPLVLVEERNGLNNTRLINHWSGFDVNQLKELRTLLESEITEEAM